jgi:hypothetical protein
MPCIRDRAPTGAELTHRLQQHPDLAMLKLLYIALDVLWAGVQSSIRENIDVQYI